MAFSEASQVFVVGSYYKELVSAFGERGKQAFIHAVRHYGMQRGSRMVQRVIRAGEKPDYAAFCRYGEWVNSAESKENGTVSVNEIVTTAPDFVMQVTRCPWRKAFADFDAAEAGVLYCTYLDEAINTGFNNKIDFKTVQTLHTADKCIFTVKNSGFTPDTNTEKHMEYVKGFDYHTAHIYYAFAEIAHGVFGHEADTVCEKVLDTFTAHYGADMCRQLTSYADENFNLAD